MGMFGIQEQHPGGGRQMTKQADAAASDINAIVNRYVAHGIAPPSGARAARYGDFSDGRSFQEQLDRVMEIERQFMELPAAVRDLCRNDPAVFLDQVADPEQLELLEKAGLKTDRVPVKPEPVTAPVEPEPETPPSS